MIILRRVINICFKFEYQLSWNVVVLLCSPNTFLAKNDDFDGFESFIVTSRGVMDK